MVSHLKLILLFLKGLYAGIVNSVQVIAQLIAGPIAGAAMSAATAHPDSAIYGQITPGIFTGAIWAVLAIPLAFFLMEPAEEKKKNGTTVN